MTEVPHTALSFTGAQYLALRSSLVSQEGLRQLLPELRIRGKAKLISLFQYENKDPDVDQQIQMAAKTKMFVEELIDDPNEFQQVPTLEEVVERLGSAPSVDYKSAHFCIRNIAVASGQGHLITSNLNTESVERRIQEQGSKILNHRLVNTQGQAPIPDDDKAFQAYIAQKREELGVLREQAVKEARATFYEAFFNHYMGRLTPEIMNRVGGIHITSDEIQALPFGFFIKIPHLYYLYIENPNIRSLPKEIAKLNLSHLKLLCPSMETLPQVILAIPTLITLEVHKNLQISSIPPALFKRLRANNSKVNYTILRKCRDDYMLNSVNGAARLWLVNPESKLLDDNMDLPPALRNKTFRCFLSWLLCIITLGMSKNIPNPIFFSARLK